MSDLMLVMRKVRPTIIICTGYLLFFVVRWSYFAVTGEFDLLWWESRFYYIPVVTVSYSVLCIVLGQKILGFATYIGTVLGFAMGYIIGPITERRSLLGFNDGDVVLVFCIDAFVMVGFIVSIIRLKKEPYLKLPFEKSLKLSVLAVCFALFLVFSMMKAYGELSRQQGAIEGYKAGYEQGMRDNNEGRAFDLKREYVPEEYRFGSAKWKGYMMYWSSGYRDGYTRKAQ